MPFENCYRSYRIKTKHEMSEIGGLYGTKKNNTGNRATIEQDLKGVYDVIPMISGRRAIK